MSNAVLQSFALPAATLTTGTGEPSFRLPLEANTELLRLCPNVAARRELVLTLRVLEEVHRLRDSRNWVREVNQLATNYRQYRGFTGGSLRRKYYDYLQSGGDWSVLLKAYKSPAKLPEEFVQEVRGLIEKNQRSIAAALQHLRDELWAKGEPVPGYGTWQEWFAKKYPALEVPTRFPLRYPEGWSVRNLRRYGPSRAARKLFGRGLGAAHGDLPCIKRTTENLRKMELIVIDDFRLDTLCAFPGDPERGIKPQITEVAGLLAMCVGTRKKLAWLLGPLVEREVKQPDGTVRQVRCNIRAVDVQVLLYKVFEQHGLPEDYDVTILCENAAASISAEVELMLGSLFGGRIKVQRTSLIENRTLANGFTETGGTPWEKGWIESEFNYLWNQLATLRGYKGSNERLNGPAWLEDQKRECLKLMGTRGAKGLALPPELIEAMSLPFANMAALERAFASVIALSELRTKHRFNGFDAVTEFRWPTPALPAPEGIDPHGPNNFAALALLTPEQQRQMVIEERKESPLERWERLGEKFPCAKLKTSALAVLLLTPKRATWRRHTVTFTHDRVGYSYVDDDNVMAGVAEGTEVLAYVDFAAPAAATVTLLSGKSLGTVRMLGNSPRGVDITNRDEVDAVRERRAKIVNRLVAEVRNRPLHQETDARLADDRADALALAAAYARAVSQIPAAEQMGERHALATAQAAQRPASARRTVSAARPSGLEQLSDDEPAVREEARGAADLDDLL